MKIAFLLYPTHRVKINEDSSFWVMYELAKRGHHVFHFESGQLFWKDGVPRAYLTPSKPSFPKGFLPSPIGKNAVDLTTMNCIFIRKEPPFDSSYLYALQLLQLIENKVLILNNPSGIALCGEKLFTLSFADLIPESLVTENPDLAYRFIKDLNHEVVIKPLDEKAGTGILAVRPENRSLPSLLTLATTDGSKKVLIQKFVSADKWGDKRILILNGEILGAFVRKPSRADFRANLSRGGSMHRTSLTRRDLKIVGALSPALNKNGLWFVGIDVIGRYLTEINVTSPSGIPEINLFYKTSAEKKVADFIEESLLPQARRSS